MNLVIIRTCRRDDFITLLCYSSVKSVIGADVIFFAEKDEYKWITGLSPAVYHPFFDNYGGAENVRGCMEYLRKINVEKYERIIFCDADLLFHKNPLELDFDFGGIKDTKNQRHFSGQCLIYTCELWEKVVTYYALESVMQTIQIKGFAIADDTVMSYIATSFTDNTMDFAFKDFWTHEKLNHLEPIK